MRERKAEGIPKNPGIALWVLSQLASHEGLFVQGEKKRGRHRAFRKRGGKESFQAEVSKDSKGLRRKRPFYNQRRKEGGGGRPKEVARTLEDAAEKGLAWGEKKKQGPVRRRSPNGKELMRLEGSTRKEHEQERTRRNLPRGDRPIGSRRGGGGERETSQKKKKAFPLGGVGDHGTGEKGCRGKGQLGLKKRDTEFSVFGGIRGIQIEGARDLSRKAASFKKGERHAGAPCGHIHGKKGKGAAWTTRGRFREKRSLKSKKRGESQAL